MARRARTMRLVSWALGGLAIGVLLVVLLANVVARTRPGHEWVLARTLEALGGNVNGTLAIDRIEGNLFEGARVYGLRLVDAEGRPFIVADSAYLDYRVTTLVSPRIRIGRAVVYDPEVYVFKLPGDSLWNYQAIFSDTTPGDTARPRVERATLIDSLRVVNGIVRVQTPWAPDSTLAPAARRREVADALSDTSLVLVDSLAGRPGYIRTMNFRELDAVVRDIRFAPGTRSGSRLRIDRLSGVAQVFRRPVRIEQARGVVALLEAHIELDFPVLRLPDSEVAVSGVVRTDSFPDWFPEDEAPMYDLAFRGDSIDFGDLLWLYPRMPEDARGSLSLRIESRPGGTMFLARDADLRAPGTHIVGSFGMIAGDTLRFVDVDLRAEPVRVALIEDMLPEGLPVVGLTLGGATITGDP